MPANVGSGLSSPPSAMCTRRSLMADPTAGSPLLTLPCSTRTWTGGRVAPRGGHGHPPAAADILQHSPPCHGRRLAARSPCAAHTRARAAWEGCRLAAPRAPGMRALRRARRAARNSAGQAHTRDRVHPQRAPAAACVVEGWQGRQRTAKFGRWCAPRRGPRARCSQALLEHWHRRGKPQGPPPVPLINWQVRQSCHCRSRRARAAPASVSIGVRTRGEHCHWHC